MKTDGRLEVISGPMYSGKSAELIAAARRLQQSELTVALFQNAKNTKNEEMTSRNGDSLPARKIDSLDEIPFHKFDAIIIDEAQFFDDAYRQVHILAEARDIGRLIVVGTLDRDFSGKKWPMYEALHCARPDKESKLTAECSEPIQELVVCGVAAEYSARLLDGQQLVEGPQQQIDEVEATYSPRCEQHFLPLKNVMSITPVTI